MDDNPMPRTKNEVLTTTEVKALLRLAAEREHRSAASMVEVLVLDYAKAHGLAVPDPGQPAAILTRERDIQEKAEDGHENATYARGVISP